MILGDYINYEKGFAFKSSHYTNKGIAIIRVSNFTENSIDMTDVYYISEQEKLNVKNIILKTDDVVIATVGSWATNPASIVGKVIRVPKEANNSLLNQNAVRLRCKYPEEQIFLYYALKDKKFSNYLLSTAQGSANQASITIKSILNYSLPHLTKNEKLKISKILNSLDQKITLNTQTNQTLEQIAQTIFKHWFIDFAPVHAKANALARGETIEQAELAAMACLSGKTAEKITALKTQDPTTYHQLQQTAAAFPSEFVETEMGLVPKGWEVKQVKDMGKIICGKTPSKKKEEFYGNDIPFIKIPDMHNNTFIIKTTDNLSLLGANNQKNKFIEKGSICISCIATVGLVSITSERSQTNQQINSIVPNSEIFTEYLYLYFSQDTMNKKLKDLASGGSATLNLNTTAFSNITLLIPNNNLIEFFHKKVQPLFDKILSNKKESISLSDARDELLPKLLRGEIEL